MWQGLQTTSPYQRGIQPLGSEVRFPTQKLHTQSQLELAKTALPPPTATSEPRTPADAVGAAHVVAVVALQPFMVVAGTPFMAVLVQLGGTHLAAAAAIRDGAHAWGAGRGHRRALAHCGTVGGHLRHQTEDQQQKLTKAGEDKSLPHATQIPEIPEGVGVCAQLKHRLNTQHCRKPHKGNSNPQSPSAWHSPGI